MPGPPEVVSSDTPDVVEDASGLIAKGVHRELGLTDDESEMIRAILGREPSALELAMYAVMWSEHCSYKSSRLHLRRLPSAGERVLVGPGENAGVVDVGDGIAVAIRIESHNHPSAIEPYQGAATGVGGILRDVFTMGARPVALMDPLFMGPLDDPRSRWIIDGVVRGIAGYGNSVGVPTVGGQIHCGSRYAGNPLVNVFCLGVLPKERLVLGRASGPGNLAVLLGARTGRDGIGGVSVLASAGFGDGGASKRPSVQIGDPFEEKRLIEACLELLDSGAVVGIQDLGGAGLSCATSETAARGGVGMDVDVRAVPCREPGMTPVEIMTSESQERMLAIVTPESLEGVREICERWEVQCSVIGRVVAAGAGGPGLLRVLDGEGGAVLASVPAASLADDAPLYERPLAPPSRGASPVNDPDLVEGGGPGDCSMEMLALLDDPSWIYRQYDHQLFLNTVVGPGEGDAAVLRLGGPGVGRTRKALALSADANPGWCAIDPRTGTAATVAESALNVACAGATPIAAVNCLNFGNPEHPEVMWQLSEAIDGMAEACLALGIPIVGGNVSLYNETAGVDIEPTPVVATVGLIEVLERRPPCIELAAGGTLLLVGPRAVGLAGSRWARELRGLEGGTLPALDLDLHRRLVELIARLVSESSAGGDGGDGVDGAGGAGGLPLLDGIHDVSTGGLAVCLAELATSGKEPVGLRVVGVHGHGELFSEAPSRVVVCTRRPGDVSAAVRAAGIDVAEIGAAGGGRFVVEGLIDLPLESVREARVSKFADALDPR